MKSAFLISRVAVASFAAFAVHNLYAANVAKIEGKTVATAASGVKAQAGTVVKTVTTPKATTAGGVVSKNGDNQYPSGQLPIPPKPKKEVLEGVGAAVKAKAAQP